MNISRITYFNIGNSADEGQDFFDVLKAGFAIFYGEEEIALVKFQSLNKSYKLEIKPDDYEWWEDAAKHVMEVNKFDTSINFLAGLIKSTDQEDNDGMIDFNNEDIQFCELRVTARLLNPTKVKVYVVYGQKWSMKRQNIMTEDKKVVSFNSSVDALNFMDKNGWEYVEQTVTTSSEGETTYKYLMRRVEQ